MKAGKQGNFELTLSIHNRLDLDRTYMSLIITSVFLLFQSLGLSHHQPEPSFACNRVADSLVLVKLYQFTDGPNWDSKWKLNLPMTQWFGVVMDINGCITELHLNSNHLKGILPPEFGNLTGLKIIFLSANNLSGSLPLNIGNLTNLEELSIEDNQLTGSIPTQISNLSKLKYLNISKNALSGSIPITLGNLSNLLTLNLNFNQLTGTIPNSISLLTKLKILDLNHNLLNGEVPSSISQLASINEIYLNSNLLSGILPVSMANLTTLVHLWVSDNLFTGMVPDLRSISLNSFHIENNSFDQIPDYSNVTTWGNQYPFGLVIYGNKFTFEDLIPLRKISANYYYSFAPQDPVTLDSIIFVPLGTNYSIMTKVDPGFIDNNFKWYKDTSIVYISNQNNYELIQVKESDEGYYSGKITNPLIPNFEILIAKFRVVVYDPGKCDIPVASTSCKAAPEFCSSLGFNGYCSTLGNSDTTHNIFLCDSQGAIRNPKWLSFIAPTDSMVLEIFPTSCPGVSENGTTYKGMQAAIWNSCGGNADSIVVCQSMCQEQPFKLGGKVFEIGHKYNLVLNGCHGDNCDFIIKVVAGNQNFILTEPGPINGEHIVCPDSLDHVFTIDKIPGTAMYQWYINDTLFSNTTIPEVNIKGFNPGSYQLKVRATSMCDTTQTSFLTILVSPKSSLSNIVRTKIGLDSAYKISFTVEGGVKPYKLIKGNGKLDTASGLFYSDTFLCKSFYDFQIIDAQGCPIVYQGFENCNCNSQAGTMSGDTIKVCEGQSLIAKFTGPEIQDPGDGGEYLLFTDPLNPTTSILKVSSNGLFPFDPAKYKFDVYYYIIRVVGRKDFRGDINFNHPCISFSNIQVVVFRSRPLVSAGPDLIFCGLSGSLSSFGNYQSGFWKLVNGPAQAFIESPVADQTNLFVTGFGAFTFVREVTNGYCTNKDEVKVTFVESLKPSVGGFYFVCSGQSTTLDGGDYPKFLWSTGDTSRFITVNTAGTYCITVTDNSNCSGSTCVAVSNSSAPVPKLSGPDTICTGNIKFLQLNQSYLKYNWSTNDSSAILQIDTGGLYCVTVTANNGCIATECIQIASMSRTYSTRYDTVCYGDNFTFHGETFDSAGIHDVIFNNASPNGCDSVVRIHLTWKPQIVLANSNVIQDDGTGNGAISVNISGGKAPYKYQWSNGGKNAIITTLIAGDYTLIVTDANNCHAAFTFSVKKLTATKQVQKKYARFLIYPNPTHENGSCFIENRSNGTDLILFVYNSNGEIVYKEAWTSKGFNDVLTLHLNLSAGIYFIKILDASGGSDIQKIILLN